MLKTIRNYRRSVLGVVGVGLVALAMGGFGINLASPGRSGSYAIKVGDKEISYEEYAQVKRNIDARYRKMLGNNYAEMLGTFNININQQAIDSTINNALLDQFVEKMGFKGSARAVQEMINENFFSGQFDAQNYASFLASQGLTPVSFENGLRTDIARQQLVDLFSDSSKASNREARAMLGRDKTAYSFFTLTIAESEEKKNAPEPSAEEIAKYYDDNLTDFQTPRQVSYNYITLDPKDFYSQVPLTPEDLELEYSDNQQAYMSEAELRISQIVLNLPEKAKDQEKEDIRKKAQEIKTKLNNGEKFEELVKLFSQDAASALKAGDAGWYKRSSLPKALASKVFGSKPGNITEPVEADNKIYIVRVDDSKEPSVRPFEEVKADILKKLQIREAPAFLVIHAQDLYEKWTNSNKSLVDFAKENSLKDPMLSGRLTKEQNPSPDLKNLTADVLASSATKKQIIEVGDKQVLTEVVEATEEGIESLEASKGKIAEILKGKAAKSLAKARAEKILAGFSSGEYKDIKEAATKNGLKPEQFLELTVSSAKGALSNPNVRDTMFSYSEAPQKPQQVFEVNNNFVLVELTAIKQPTEEDYKLGLEEMRTGLGKDLSNFALDSFISKLKAETKIDIRPGLMGES